MRSDIVGRLPFGLARLLNVTGPEGAPNSLASQVQPVLDVEGLLPERCFLRGERRFMNSADVTGGAAQFAAVGIALPSPSSAILAILEAVFITNVDAGNQQVLVYVGNIGATLNPQSTQPSLDLRQGNTAGPACSFGSTTNFVTPVFNAQARFYLPTFGNIQLLNIPAILTVNPTAGQTNSVIIASATAATRSLVTLVWRERPVAATELIL